MKKIEFFKVEGNKINRVRRHCPKCGPGVFIADHKDRFSCGKCGYTEFKPGVKKEQPIPQDKPAEKPKEQVKEETTEPEKTEEKPEEPSVEETPQDESPAEEEKPKDEKLREEKSAEKLK